MSRTTLLGAGLALALGAAACQEQVTEPRGALGADASGPVALHSTAPAGPGVDRGSVDLPAGVRATDQQLAEAAARAIDPGNYQCPPSTALIDWLIGELGLIFAEDPAAYQLLFFNLAADIVPAFDALLFQTEDTPQYFGYEGEYTRLLLKTEKDVKRFWDIFSDDIQLVAMHGTMLLDVERVSTVYQVVFGVPPATADFFATLVRNAMLSLESVNGGNHPIFTFNAFAATGGGIPDKIVMGDGVLAGYEALGFEDVAPQAVYAHEFAHHIQFENDYFADPIPSLDPPATQAEATRYSELMADAMAAYYLTHARGATLRQKRVEQFLQVFFDIGDCAFTNPGHHGTPNQRMAASRFGFEMAAQAQKQGHILSAEAFHDAFVEAYLDLIAPDV